MKTYIVTGRSARLGIGLVVFLAKDLADPRASSLEADKAKGKYTITKPIELKKGQEFGLEGDVPKNLLAGDLVTEKASAKAKKPPAGKPAASKSGARRASSKKTAKGGGKTKGAAT